METGMYCLDWGVDNNLKLCCDWCPEEDEMWSDEERHLEIQTVVTCCRDDYLRGPRDTTPECKAAFLVEGNIAIKDFFEFHNTRKSYVCSTCAEQYMSLFCHDCDVIFANEESLVTHMTEKHDYNL